MLPLLINLADQDQRRHVAERRYAICQNALATGTTPTAAFPTGPNPASGGGSLSLWPRLPTPSMRRSTAPSCAPLSTAPAPKKPGEDQTIGRSRGGLSTKIHTLLDALGNPIGFHLTDGEAHDLVGADHLLPEMQAEALIANKPLMPTSGSSSR